MKKFFAYLLAALFAAMTTLPASAFAQDQKREQVHKGTPAQGTVQKKEQQKAHKQDGSGKAKAVDKK